MITTYLYLWQFIPNKSQHSAAKIKYFSRAYNLLYWYVTYTPRGFEPTISPFNYLVREEIINLSKWSPASRVHLNTKVHCLITEVPLGKLSSMLVNARSVHHTLHFIQGIDHVMPL